MHVGFFQAGQKKKKKLNKNLSLSLSGFFPWAHLGTVGLELSALCRPPPSGCTATFCYGVCDADFLYLCVFIIMYW